RRFTAAFRNTPEDRSASHLRVPVRRPDRASAVRPGVAAQARIDLHRIQIHDRRLLGTADGAQRNMAADRHVAAVLALVETRAAAQWLGRTQSHEATRAR